MNGLFDSKVYTLHYIMGFLFNQWVVTQVLVQGKFGKTELQYKEQNLS